MGSTTTAWRPSGRKVCSAQQLPMLLSGVGHLKLRGLKGLIARAVPSQAWRPDHCRSPAGFAVSSFMVNQCKCCKSMLHCITSDTFQAYLSASIMLAHTYLQMSSHCTRYMCSQCTDLSCFRLTQWPIAESDAASQPLPPSTSAAVPSSPVKHPSAGSSSAAGGLAPVQPDTHAKAQAASLANGDASANGNTAAIKLRGGASWLVSAVLTLQVRRWDACRACRGRV